MALEAAAVGVSAALGTSTVAVAAYANAAAWLSSGSTEDQDQDALQRVVASGYRNYRKVAETPQLLRAAFSDPVDVLRAASAAKPGLTCSAHCLVDQKPLGLKFVSCNGEVLAFGSDHMVATPIVAMGGAEVSVEGTTVTIVPKQMSSVAIRHDSVQKAQEWSNMLKERAAALSEPVLRLSQLLEEHHDLHKVHWDLKKFHHRTISDLQKKASPKHKHGGGHGDHGGHDAGHHEEHHEPPPVTNGGGSQANRDCAKHKEETKATAAKGAAEQQAEVQRRLQQSLFVEQARNKELEKQRQALQKAFDELEEKVNGAQGESEWYRHKYFHVKDTEEAKKKVRIEEEESEKVVVKSVCKLEAANREADSEVARLKQQLRFGAAQIKELQEQSQAMQQTLAASESQVREAKAESEWYKHKLSHMKDARWARCEEEDEPHVISEATNALVNDLKAPLPSAEVAELEAKLARQHEDLTASQALVSELRGRCTRAEEDLAAAQSQISELTEKSTRVEEAEAHAADQAAARTAQEMATANAEEAMTRLAEAKDVHQDEVLLLKDELCKSKAKVEVLLQAKNALEAASVSKKGQSDELQEVVSSGTSPSSLAEKQRLSSQELQALKAHMKSHSSRVKSAEAKSLSLAKDAMKTKEMLHLQRDHYEKQLQGLQEKLQQDNGLSSPARHAAAAVAAAASAAGSGSGRGVVGSMGIFTPASNGVRSEVSSTTDSFAPGQLQEQVQPAAPWAVPPVALLTQQCQRHSTTPLRAPPPVVQTPLQRQPAMQVLTPGAEPAMQGLYSAGGAVPAACTPGYPGAGSLVLPNTTPVRRVRRQTVPPGGPDGLPVMVIPRNDLAMDRRSATPGNFGR